MDNVRSPQPKSFPAVYSNEPSVSRIFFQPVKYHLDFGFLIYNGALTFIYSAK